MKKLNFEHRGILEIVKRLPSSINGNPRYLVRIGVLECRTAPDSMIAYGITNHEDKPVTATLGMFYNHLTVKEIK